MKYPLRSDIAHSEGDLSFFLTGQIHGHSQTRALDESLDQSGQDHFAATAAVWMTTSATQTMASVATKPITKKDTSLMFAFPSLQFSIECAGTDPQSPGGFHGGD